MTLTYNAPGISSVMRIQRFENHQPKQLANQKCRESFDIAGTGLAVGLLGISDARFYVRHGFEQEQIITVERDPWPTLSSLRNDLAEAGLGDVRVINGDVFDYIETCEDGSISALFLDLFGFAELCSTASSAQRDRKLEKICPKLANSFHFMFTYEDQRSKPIWEQRLSDGYADANRSKHVFKVCQRILRWRDIEVDSLVTERYQGLLSDGRTCRMVTSSFVGHPA